MNRHESTKSAKASEVTDFRAGLRSCSVLDYNPYYSDGGRDITQGRSSLTPGRRIECELVGAFPIPTSPMSPYRLWLRRETSRVHCNDVVASRAGLFLPLGVFIHAGSWGRPHEGGRLPPLPPGLQHPPPSNGEVGVRARVPPATLCPHVSE